MFQLVHKISSFTGITSERFNNSFSMLFSSLLSNVYTIVYIDDLFCMALCILMHCVILEICYSVLICHCAEQDNVITFCDIWRCFYSYITLFHTLCSPVFCTLLCSIFFLSLKTISLTTAQYFVFRFVILSPSPIRANKTEIGYMIARNKCHHHLQVFINHYHLTTYLSLLSFFFFTFF